MTNQLLEDVQILDLDPVLTPSPDPIIDEITRKVAAAFMQEKEQGLVDEEGVFIPNLAALSWVICTCGNAAGERMLFKFSNGVIMSPFALHYVAYHRAEVLERDIEIINQFPYGEIDPPDNWLCPS